MKGHTPGPWERRAPPVFDSGNPWAVVAPDGQVLAIVRYGGLGNLLPAEANARLIAAAPEMYEKGKALLEALGFPGGGWDMDLPGAAEVMAFFDALAKAEGWTP